MNCKKIQELIMTDYIDSETTEALQKEIKGHLNICADCRKFAHDLQILFSEFRKIEAVKPPEEVWHKIVEAIELRREEESLFERTFNFLRDIFLVRKPVFALSTAITVMIVAILFSHTPFYKQRMVNNYLREESDYLVFLNTPVNGSQEQDINFGTAIERYLF